MGSGTSTDSSGSDGHQQHVLCDPSQLLTQEQIGLIQTSAQFGESPLSFIECNNVKQALLSDAKYYKVLSETVAHFNDRDHLVHFAQLVCGVDLSDRSTILTEEQLRNILLCDAQLFFQLQSHALYFGCGESAPSAVLTPEEEQQIVDFAIGYFDKGAKLVSFCSRRAPAFGASLGKLLLAKFAPSDVQPAERETSAIVSDRVSLWMMHLLPFSSIVNSLGVDGSAVIPWTLIYSSARDGQSMNGFVSRVTNYPAATVTLLRVEDTKAVLGFYRTSEWTSSSSFSGESIDYVFSLRPKFRCLATSGISQNFVYFHVPSKTYTANILYDGIGIGGQLDHFRFSLDGDLKTGFFRKHGSTFDSNVNLLNDAEDETPFTVETMEVWGLGGEAAIQQRDLRSTKDKNLALSNRKVNRAQMAGAGPDQDMALLELAGAHKSYVKDADHV